MCSGSSVSLQFPPDLPRGAWFTAFWGPLWSTLHFCWIVEFVGICTSCPHLLLSLAAATHNALLSTFKFLLILYGSIQFSTSNFRLRNLTINSKLLVKVFFLGKKSSILCRAPKTFQEKKLEKIYEENTTFYVDITS